MIFKLYEEYCSGLIEIIVILSLVIIIYRPKKSYAETVESSSLKMLFHRTFCILNILVFVVLFGLISPLLFIAAILSSVFGISLFILGACTGVLSIISLTNPKYTKRIFLLYVLMYGAYYMESYDTKKLTYYNEICNELREDPYCVESNKGFICSKESQRGFFESSKEICVNNSGANNSLKFIKSNSSYIGKTYSTRMLMFYKMNMPRNDCRNNDCSYVQEVLIVPFHNGCTNCLGEDRVKTKMRMAVILSGSNLKVIDSYKFKNLYSFSDIPSMERLIVQDEAGKKSEISTSDFEREIINYNPNPQRVNFNQEKYDKVLNNINVILQGGSITEFICDYNHSEADEEIKHLPRNSKYVEVKLLNFTNSFKIENEMIISNLYWQRAVEENHSSKNSEAVKKQVMKCAEIEFKTVSAYLLSYYHFKDWGLHGQIFTTEDLNADCLPPSYKGKTVLSCDKLEGKKPFKIKTYAELKAKYGLNYKRDDEKDFLE